MPVAEKNERKILLYYANINRVLPGQRYQSKRDEIQQIVRFLENHGIKEIELAVASSIGERSCHGILTEAKNTGKACFF